MGENFVHLHVHSEFSLLDGITPVPELIEKVSKLGMGAVALTDHGNMFGMVKLFEKAKKAGIKPILGCEIYVAPRRLTDKEHPFDKDYFHLLLLVKNNQGYKNLTKIVSTAYSKGFYYKPRADRALLEEHSEGIIACSACLGGQVAQLILNEKMDEAREAALWHQRTFGEGNYYLEIMEHGLEGQKTVNDALIEMSRELSIPLVATNDVHYLEPGGARVQDVMMCIQKGKTLHDVSEEERRSAPGGAGGDSMEGYAPVATDTDSFSFASHEFYLKTGEQMREVFPGQPGALAATAEIADSIDFELELGNIYLPYFEVPEGRTDGGYLRELTFAGLEKKYPEVTDEIRERAEFELKVIGDMGYPAYFLIVWDLIRHAREKNIPVGPGRGSVAGSIVAYALDITKVDPLKYDLLFERFLNPARVSMPDIDMDFCYERRDEMIEYAAEKYGREKVCMIITFGRLKARFAIRDVGRVLGLDLAMVDRIAKMVPAIIPDKKVTIENALEYSPDLKYEYDNDERVKELLDISKRIEGLARNVSTHAAGVVISKYPLEDIMPIYQGAGDDIAMTQVTGEELERMGLLKMDFLGLRTLTVMHDAARFAGTNRGVEIDLDRLPLDDKKTYELFCRAETDGIFQFEGNTVKNLMMRIHPNCIGDLIALNALNRPGPLGGGMADTFIENRGKKPEDIDCIHDLIRPVLLETFGIMLYQEQVMRIANIIADFSLAQSDLLRRAMGKKKKKEMDKLKGEFIENAAKKTGDRDLAEHLFGLILQFSGYGFNKSHSAAYAILAYQTGYLKANYPVEFMAALLTSIMKDTSKVARYIDDCKRMGVTVSPPDINNGFEIFTPKGDRIIFGLGAVKNVGRNAVRAIVEEREKNGEYKTIYELCSRVDLHEVNSKTLESLIRCGACDCLDGNRAQKIMALEDAMEYGRVSQRDRISGQGSLFDDEETGVIEPQLKEYEEFGVKRILEDEKELLGLYLSHHPLDPYRKWLRAKTNYTAVKLLEIEPETRQSVRVGGMIRSRRDFTTRRGDQMSSLEVEDFSGRFLVTVFPEQRRELIDELQEGNVVAIGGQAQARQIENMDGDVRLDVRVICRRLQSYFSEPADKPAAKRPKKVRRRIHVRFKAGPGGKQNRKLIRELKNLTGSSPGETAVIVHLDENGSGRKFLLKGNEIRYSPEFLRIARRYFGQDHVWVETEKA